MRKGINLKLNHPEMYFTKKYISFTSKSIGLLRKDILETHFWVYELHSQIQKKSNNRCILKGGASTNLYLPINLQRCTNDIDCVTDLSPRELNKIMHSIKDDFLKNNVYTSYREYIPKKTTKVIPMMTFIFHIPFVFKTKQKLRYPGIKIDFLFLDIEKVHKEIISNRKTLGLKLYYKPISIDKYSTISDKLITLSTNYLGLEMHKLDGLYKNIYDLYCLISTYNDLKSFKIISERIQESLLCEIKIKNGISVDIESLLNDILHSLYHIATFSLIINHSELPLEIIKFQQFNLQESVRNILNTDMWSIMCFYLYIWVFSLKDYILHKNYSHLDGINIAVEEYEYYLSLGKKSRREFKFALKERIKSKDNSLVLDGTGNPLRLIYLDYILTNMKPN